MNANRAYLSSTNGGKLEHIVKDESPSEWNSVLSHMGHRLHRYTRYEWKILVTENFIRRLFTERYGVAFV